MATNSRADLLKECRTTTTVVELNAADLEHAQTDRELLEVTVAEIEEAVVRQKHHKFQFQQASRDLERLTALARDLLLRLRNVVRGKYGMTSEKLAEFGLNPRRTRTPAAPKEPLPEIALTPPQTAPSETDGTLQK
jgi:uncharacterized protein (DUF3084 family)